MTISNLLENSAKIHSRRKALIFNKKVYTYKKLNALSNQFARLYHTKYNFTKKTTVGILLNNCPQYIINIFSIIKTGAVLIPVNRFLTAREIQYIISDCNISYLISSTDFNGHFENLQKNCSSLKKILLVDEPNSIKEKNTSTINQIDSFSEKNLNTAIDDNDIAVIIYTSGTTGYPKGAMLSHKNLLANVKSCSTLVRVVKSDRLLLALPMFHSFTFTVCVLMPIANGACIIGLSSIQPFKDVLRNILFHRVTIFIGIPKIYDILSEKTIPWYIKIILKIRVCFSGSAPLCAQTLNNFKQNIKLILLEGYGLSEASPVVAVNPPFGEQKAGSVGLPIQGVKIKIVDDKMNELPIGQAGEILVKGDNVMLGYYNKPKATEETMRNGWLKTGDIGKLDNEGYLYIVDRQKNMILSQGMNIYPREIEEAILRNNSVAETAVIGINDKKHGETAVAFIVLKENKTLTKKELQNFCKEHLARYKCPRKFIFLEKLPRSGIGKILKKDLLDVIK